jgi:flagellar biosynthetic protein FliO
MDFGQQYLGAAFVLGLLGAALWWLRRRGYAAVAPGRRAGRKMESIERLPLDPQHTLHLVRIGGTALLVACSPAGCVLLQSVPAAQIERGGGQ